MSGVSDRSWRGCVACGMLVVGISALLMTAVFADEGEGGAREWSGQKGGGVSAIGVGSGESADGPAVQTGSTIGASTAVMPVGVTAPPFTVRVSIDSLEHAGFFGCRVTVVAATSFQAERQYTVRLTPVDGGFIPSTNGIVCELPLVVPQGERSVTIDRRVPTESVGDRYRVELLEDGRPLEGFSSEFGGTITPPSSLVEYLMNRDLSIRVLAVFDEAGGQRDRYLKEQRFRGDWVEPPGVSPSFSASPQMVWYRTPTPTNAALTTTVPLQEVRETDWRGFQAYDVVVMTPEAMIKLRREAADVGDAIRDWLLVGGIVVLAGADDARSGTEAISVGSPESATLAQLDSKVWSCPAGAGRLIGVPGAGSGDGFAPIEWVRARGLIESDGRRSLTLRRGVEPVLGDRRFGRWLIAGVAQPPVYTFIGLLTAFVILVGPIAYRQTVRSGRGYLMFAIAPALALATTGTMLAYGIVSDGFGTLARVRQITWIEGASGAASERVRATYFAGLRPADGLKFPGSAELFTVRERMARGWNRDGTPELLGTVTSGESSLTYSPSFLASREQRQFVFHRPLDDFGAIRLRAESGQPPRLSSGLSFPVRELIIRDRDGKYWRKASLEAGATGVACDPLEDLEAATTLARLYGRFRLLDASSPAGRRSAGRYTNMAELSQSIPTRLALPPESSEGVFEHWLVRHLQIEGSLPESTFVSVADVSEDAVAVEGAEVVDSVRFVIGSLP